MEGKRIIEIQGENGMIYLGVPNRKPTDKEKKELYRAIAISILNTEKSMQEEKEAT